MAANNDETDKNRSNELWDAVVESSPFLKNFLGPVKAQVIMTPNIRVDLARRSYTPASIDSR